MTAIAAANGCAQGTPPKVTRLDSSVLNESAVVESKPNFLNWFRRPKKSHTTEIINYDESASDPGAVISEHVVNGATAKSAGGKAPIPSAGEPNTHDEIDTVIKNAKGNSPTHMPADDTAHFPQRTQPPTPPGRKNRTADEHGETASAQTTARMLRRQIDAMVLDLEQFDPASVDTFLQAAQSAAGKAELTDVLAVWESTIARKKRMFERQAPVVYTSKEPLPALPPQDTQSRPQIVEPPPRSPDRRPLPSADEPDIQLPTARPTQWGEDDRQLPTLQGGIKPVGVDHSAARVDADARQVTHQASSGADSRRFNEAAVMSNVRDDRDRFEKSAPSSGGESSDVLMDRIRQLAREMDDLPATSGGEHLKMQVYGRMLHLMAGDVVQGARPIVGVDHVDRQFWRSQLWAFHQFFDEAGNPRAESRSNDTIHSLYEAIGALRQRADLDITQPVLCKSVTNFGVYEEFPTYEFKAGQPVVAYTEIRNFASLESKEGYRTRLDATFEIFDMQGQSQLQFTRNFKDDLCRNMRQDYFHTVLFQLPAKMPPGEYILKVRIDDQTTRKFAEKQRRLTVVK